MLILFDEMVNGKILRVGGGFNYVIMILWFKWFILISVIFFFIFRLKIVGKKYYIINCLFCEVLVSRFVSIVFFFYRKIIIVYRINRIKFDIFMLILYVIE